MSKEAKIEAIPFDAETRAEVAAIYERFSYLNGNLAILCKTYARANGHDPARWQLAQDGSGLIPVDRSDESPKPE